MSYLKILDVSDPFLKKVAGGNFMGDVNCEIEARLPHFEEKNVLPYDKHDMIQLIRTIETYKMKCLKGDITVKRLYDDVVSLIRQFRAKHPGFDYLKDPALNAYFS